MSTEPIECYITQFVFENDYYYHIQISYSANTKIRLWALYIKLYQFHYTVHFFYYNLHAVDC